MFSGLSEMGNCMGLCSGLQWMIRPCCGVELGFSRLRRLSIMLWYVIVSKEVWRG